MTRTRLIPLATLAGFFFALQAPHTSSAKPSNGSLKLLELLHTRPRGMTVDTWREQRREAARELGRLHERRAVPQLLQIVEKERFDVILEIAIDALGNIGDKRAVEPLETLLNDPSLDGYVRDAVAGSLRKLKADDRRDPEPFAPRGDGSGKRLAQPTPPTEHRTARAAPGPCALEATDPEGDFTKLPRRPALPRPRNLIALHERLDIVVGTLGVRWDGAAETTTGNLGGGTRYKRQMERRDLGYSIEGSTRAAFRFDDPPDDDDNSWSIEHALDLAGEARYYPFRNDLPQMFGQVVAGAAYGLTVADPPSALDKRFTFGSTISLGAGPGYGRVVNVGPRLRLRRFVRALRQAGVLRSDVPAEVADDLVQLWYDLRNTIGSFAPLGYSLRLLSSAHLLARQPDPASVYRLVRVLDDPQLFERDSGLMFRLGYGYAHELLLDADDRDFGFLYSTAQLRRQIGTIRELDATFRFFWNHLGSPDTFTLSLSGGYNWYLYNRALDPLGALGAQLSLGLGNQPGAAFQDGGIAYQLLGGISYSRFFDRGSRIVASLLGGAQRRGGMMMLTVEARYGVAAGSYAAASR